MSLGLTVGGTIQINYKIKFITFLKILLFHKYFSAIFLELYQKTFDPFQIYSIPLQQITPYHSNSSILLYTK